MVWIKRLIFVFVLVAIVVAWPLYRKYRLAGFEEKAEVFSQITAAAWVASAEYRDAPERFLVCRDSILTARGYTREELEEFLTHYSDEAEAYAKFVELVSKHVDSLVALRAGNVEPAIEEEPPVGDSKTKVIDTAK
ncbi:MAG: hypothetical protein AAB305_05490 [Candidatus Zixiibacteriota bacterium]